MLNETRKNGIVAPNEQVDLVPKPAQDFRDRLLRLEKQLLDTAFALNRTSCIIDGTAPDLPDLKGTTDHIDELYQLDILAGYVLYMAEANENKIR